MEILWPILHPIEFPDLLRSTANFRFGRRQNPHWDIGGWKVGHSKLSLGLIQFFLLLRFPLTFFLALFPLISNCSVNASWGYTDGFLCSFSLIELKDLESRRIRNPGRFPAIPRDNTNPPTRAPTRSRFLLAKAHSHPVLGLTRIATAVSKYGEGSRCGSIEFDCVLYNTSLSHPPPRATLIPTELETTSSEYLGLYRSPWYFIFTLRACALNVSIYTRRTSIFPRARTTWTFLSSSTSASASTQCKPSFALTSTTNKTTLRKGRGYPRWVHYCERQLVWCRATSSSFGKESLKPRYWGRSSDKLSFIRMSTAISSWPPINLQNILYARASRLLIGLPVSFSQLLYAWPSTPGIRVKDVILVYICCGFHSYRLDRLDDAYHMLRLRDVAWWNSV